MDPYDYVKIISMSKLRSHKKRLSLGVFFPCVALPIILVFGPALFIQRPNCTDGEIPEQRPNGRSWISDRSTQVSVTQHLRKTAMSNEDSAYPMRHVQFNPAPPAPKMPRGKITAGLSMHPDQSHSIGLQIMLAGGADLPACRAYIEMDVRSDYSSVEVAETQVRIRAQHSDGTPAGQINGPGEADDVGSWRNRYVPFLSDSRSGSVKVWFEVLGPDMKKVIAKSNVEELEFVLPDVHVGYGDWKPSSSVGTWERPIYVVADTKVLGIINFAGTPVQVKQAFAPGTGAVSRASWFSKTQGTVVNGADSEPGTGLPPPTAIQYWRETSDGTRQLNAYRVQAIVDQSRLCSMPPKGKKSSTSTASVGSVPNSGFPAKKQSSTSFDSAGDTTL